MNMYYIAIVAPEEINKQILKWKNFFKENFQCSAALKSPAHITLIPPFWMNEELERDLVDSITDLSGRLTSFRIQLKDFSAFTPKVIFVDIIESEMLNILYHSTNKYIQQQNKFPVKEDGRPFQPHVTLATRDLYKKDFYEAWERFATKKYEAFWDVNGISLLRHNKKNWDVIFTSQFDFED